MYKVKYLKTNGEGYINFRREYLKRLYAKKNKELTEDKLQSLLRWTDRSYTIWYDDYKDLMSKEEIIKLIKDVNAEYEEIETDAIDM